MVNSITGSSLSSMNYNNAVAAMNSSIEKLSSGKNVNRASDNPSVVSTITHLNTKSSGLEVANKNINDAVTVLQTAQDGLQSITERASVIRDLVVQYQSSTTSSDEKLALKDEIKSHIDQIKYVIDTTDYKGEKLITCKNTFNIQTGYKDGQQVSFTINDGGLNEALALYAKNSDAVVNSLLTSKSPLDYIDDMTKDIASVQSNLGNVENRFASIISDNLSNITTTNAALSNINDVDFATEISKLTTSQIQAQVANSMVSFANDNKSLILSLLK